MEPEVGGQEEADQEDKEVCRLIHLGQRRDLAASPEGKRRWLSQSQACNSWRSESGVAGEVSLASTTSAISSACVRGARTSTPRRQDESDRTDEEVLDESAAKEKPAKKTRGLRSSSRSSASGGDEGGSSSSSEDGGPEEDRVLEESDQKKLFALEKGDCLTR